MDLEPLRDAIEAATGDRPSGRPRPIGGGCIHEAFQLGDFFVKSNTPDSLAMFEAEERGLAALHETATVRVPRPLRSGIAGPDAYLVLEYLPLGGDRSRSHPELGRKLAALHRCTGEAFGAHRDNFIGSTPQPNPTHDSWFSFYREERLVHILRLAEGCGHRFERTGLLLDHLDRFFEEEPPPSPLHGDLWGGNADALSDGTPVVFDPAFYYGDREADLAMTTLFGGFSPAFYDAYNEAWPLPPGHENRRDLYTLYHILNHAVLFGGGYARQAQGTIDRLGRLVA